MPLSADTPIEIPTKLETVRASIDLPEGHYPCTIDLFSRPIPGKRRLRYDTQLTCDGEIPVPRALGHTAVRYRACYSPGPSDGAWAALAVVDMVRAVLTARCQHGGGDMGWQPSVVIGAADETVDDEELAEEGLDE